jgi:2-polyprenyl-3-methyl-5-hydroxy-6-metoxy-1,4-benzoquinol methylase
MSEHDKINEQTKSEQLETFRRDTGEDLTTNQGVRVDDTDNSLKVGSRGPTLMEDFHFREKMTHFDHERIPERVVHARGSGAHGYFQVYESMAEYTKTKFLQDPSVQTPVFVRFSTVVGFRGSADTVRDVRGDEHKFDFDILDATKLIPEELVPIKPIGKMVLNRNPDNFFAETEQVALHPGHVVPGIDFSNDPLPTPNGAYVLRFLQLMMHNNQRKQQHLGIVDNLLMQMFGRPKGILGRLGGFILARTKRDFTQWVIHLLEIQPDDKVLEVGFGPGVGIQILADAVSTGYVAGVDYSKEMVQQAKALNTKAIEAGLVQLQYGSVEALPFADDTFDKTLAINSMQVWSDAMVGLREMRRVMKVGGKIALGFTPQSGQSSTGLTEMLAKTSFTEACLVETDRGFCLLATK